MWFNMLSKFSQHVLPLPCNLISVRPSTPFSTDTDTPIFCRQPMPMLIPMRYRYASRADVVQRDGQIKGSRRRRRRN